MKDRFDLGCVVATVGATAGVTAGELAEALAKHKSGDFGDMCAEDCELNNDAISSGGRVHSSYKTENGLKFWIITELLDENITTVLLPSEY